MCYIRLLHLPLPRHSRRPGHSDEEGRAASPVRIVLLAVPKNYPKQPFSTPHQRKINKTPHIPTAWHA